MISKVAEFNQARPVWAKGLETEMNLSCCFRAALSLEEHSKMTLRVAASTIYRVMLNGKLIAYGPARCAHSFFRVDEWPLEIPAGEENSIAIDVAGYNVNSYAYLDQPSFLQAELLCKGEAVLFTGANGGFEAYINHTRQQRAQRYGFQRTFTEAYVISGEPEQDYIPAAQEEQPPKKLLTRNVPLPIFTVQKAGTMHSEGVVGKADKPRPPFMDRGTEDIGPMIKGFVRGELDAYLTDDVFGMAFTPQNTRKQQTPPLFTISQNRYATFEFSRDTSGFISLEVSAKSPCCLYLLFDERLSDDDVDPVRKGCVNIVRYKLRQGTHRLMTIEPYTMKYLKIICTDGKADIGVPAIVEYKANLPVKESPIQAENELKTVYDAAVETFLQNSIDIFMDNPSRERAGWLCDGFFSARAEYCITGQNRVEENFLENFLLPDKFEHLPDGMLPMCYPSDHINGNFIPNWAMWLVLQLEDYLTRGGNRSFVAAFKPKVYALLDYFAKFLNADGLLESLEGWVFLDWSRSSDDDLVQGVNYPSNMVYARMLQAVAALYGDAEAAAQAKKTHEVIRKQSFNGTCFIDHASRENGVLVPGSTTTEACQDYAFFCGTATPELYPALWQDYRKQFKADEQLSGKYDLDPANAFIGLFLRLATLSRYGAYDEIERAVRNIFYPQAVATGTLWEQLTDIASLDQGFSSYTAELITQLVNRKSGS